MFRLPQCALPDSAVKRLALHPCIGRVLFSKSEAGFAAEKHATKACLTIFRAAMWFPHSSKMV
jgi:hypothetical protein